MSVALTRSHALNALKCYGNYALSLFGLVRISHMPTFVSVEPAAVCQLHCPACPVGLRNFEVSKSRNSEKYMSHAVWERVLAEIRETALTIQFYFQGEPLLNKDLPVMIREAHEAGLYTIVSTNAQAMTQDLANELVRAGLDRIIVSMDGLTDESYNAYRIGGSLEKTKAALRYLRTAKGVNQSVSPKDGLSVKRSVSETVCQRSGHLLIELQCLRLKTNEHEWAQLKRVYKSLGADRLTLKTAQLYDYANGHPLMPSNPRYSRYIQGPDGLFHRKPIGKTCLRVWSGCVITTNGDVLPCCYDKAHAHAYGNIMSAPLRELYGNEKALAFRRAALRQQSQICQECYK